MLDTDSLLDETQKTTLASISDAQKAAIKAMFIDAAKIQAKNLILSEFSKATALALPYGKEVKALTHIVNTEADLTALNDFITKAMALGCGFSLVIQAPQGDLFQKWNKDVHKGVVGSKSELSNK